MKIIYDGEPDFSGDTILIHIKLTPDEVPELAKRLLGPPKATVPYAEYAREALTRAAEYATTAGKSRTAAWLQDCANLGMGIEWPPAPAYKGSVLHVEDSSKSLQDLAAMEAHMLLRLRDWVHVELRTRGFAIIPAEGP